jgi:PHP family Zn ribbon phosphoesterase
VANGQRDNESTNDRLSLFKADLHIHTVLSACAEVEMISPLILQEAEKKGVNLIAITDHNACHNAPAVMEAAEGTNIHVMPGMEIQSREEVHLLCLFDDLPSCLTWQEMVFQKLPPLINKESLFGPQYVVDAHGEWLWTEERLLATSVDMSLEEIVSQVALLGGLVIPAHVNRSSYSVLANLGFIPQSLAAQAMEVTPNFVKEESFRQWPQLMNHCLIINGDAHRLGEIQNRTMFKLAYPLIKEMLMAFQGQQGRQVMVVWPNN